MNKDLIAIFEYLEREKGINREIVIKAIEESLHMAARKSITGGASIEVSVNSKTGEIEVLAEKEVVDTVALPGEEILLEEARELDPDCELGQWIQVSVTPEDFGRIAAQTARQVISQKIRVAERDVIHEEYRHRLHELVTGTVKRIVRGGTLIVDLGKVEALLPDRFYPRTERYHIGDRVQALLYEVRDTEGGGAEVILSRSHPEMVVELFKQEVPELSDETIKIERIAREAGYRTKIAVSSNDLKVDPLGACVGVRGTRVKNIIRELNNEKIDVILYSHDSVQLLKDALKPIEIKKISINEDDKLMSIVVDDEDYPIALGRRGMNARLNGELIQHELEVKKMSDYQTEMTFQRDQISRSEDPELDNELEKIEGLHPFVFENVKTAGFDTARKILQASPQELSRDAGISLEMAEDIVEKIRKNQRT